MWIMLSIDGPHGCEDSFEVNINLYSGNVGVQLGLLTRISNRSDVAARKDHCPYCRFSRVSIMRSTVKSDC